MIKGLTKCQEFAGKRDFLFTCRHASDILEVVRDQRMKLGSWQNEWPLLKKAVDEAETFADS